jgi:hypothetical protein
MRRRMSYEKYPDGRMDMKYVIYRLEKILQSEGGDEIKVINLEFFISEIRSTLSVSGESREQAPVIY